MEKIQPEMSQYITDHATTPGGGKWKHHGIEFTVPWRILLSLVR
jgi:hypothetical protein